MIDIYRTVFISSGQWSIKAPNWHVSSLPGQASTICDRSADHSHQIYEETKGRAQLGGEIGGGGGHLDLPHCADGSAGDQAGQRGHLQSVGLRRAGGSLPLWLWLLQPDCRILPPDDAQQQGRLPGVDGSSRGERVLGRERTCRGNSSCIHCNCQRLLELVNRSRASK